MIITAAILIGLLAILYVTSTFWVNWWWFESVGYKSVLITKYASYWGSFAVGAVLAALFFGFNWGKAIRNGRKLALDRPAGPFGTPLGKWLLRLATLVVAYYGGVWAADRWELWRLFASGGSFGVKDATFNLDAGFYVFKLPAIQSIVLGIAALTVLSLVAVIAIYIVSLGLEQLDLQNPPKLVRRHVFGLIALLLLVLGAWYWLANYDLVYSHRGYVYGVGYTDAHIVRPLNTLVAIAAVVLAVLILLSGSSRRNRLLGAFGVLLVVLIGLGLVLPPMIQNTFVVPNELSRETSYIENNINLTRAAYDFADEETRTISGQGDPSPASIAPNSPLLDNVRLWDYRVAQPTFQQLRSYRPYYVFNDLDVDRYMIDGRETQVLISARELDFNGLPANAQTWVNQHLAYTHGYGVALVPISEATRQGLPVFTVGQVPPEGTGAIEITQPQIYFGEVGGGWIALDTSVEEINGLPGETEAEPYAGKAVGSVKVDNYLRRVMLAIYNSDRRMLFSSEMGPESKVVLYRDIMSRAHAVAPYLHFDPDPYPIIADGRIVWVLDAYTVTDRYPGSTPAEIGINYIRHTAKVTIDAYDGTVTIYRTAIPDPIADAYASIYHHSFVAIEDAPQVIRDHFRYPEALFDIQTQMYGSYHVTDPVAFYNGEDRWQIAEEQAQEGRGQFGEGQVPVEAYYMTIPLPGESVASFKIVRPFTPISRTNMTAWMASRLDEKGLPHTVVYRFPGQSNVPGPEQMEARINQDPDISARITLLDQAGSRVIRGNLLVLPVEETVLYVQPLYLQATGAEGAPTELQFVIVATNTDVQMRPTLEEALAALNLTEPSSTDANVEGDSGQPDSGEAIPTGDLATQAMEAFLRGEDALQDGDWAAYGKAQQELQILLEQMSGNGASEPAPAATPVP